MDKTYTVRAVTGGTMQAHGIDTPVPGLALVSPEACDCGQRLYALLHVRSGAAVFYTHTPEALGEEQWARLKQFDWDRSADEIDADPNLNEILAAVMVITGNLYMGTEKTHDLYDVDPPTKRY